MTLFKSDYSTIAHPVGAFWHFHIAVVKLVWVNNANQYYYYHFPFFSLFETDSNGFKIFHKIRFKDLSNQRWLQRILVVWELCPNVVFLRLTAGKDLKYFSSCLFSIVYFRQWVSANDDPSQDCLSAAEILQAITEMNILIVSSHIKNQTFTQTFTVLDDSTWTVAGCARDWTAGVQQMLKHSKTATSESFQFIRVGKDWTWHHSKSSGKQGKVVK